MLGLTLLAAAAITIAAFNVFGEMTAEAQRALLFSLSALGLCTIPILAFVAWRMSGLARQNRQLFSRATQDGLTQILNKTAFRTGVEAEIMRGPRRIEDSRPYTLLIIDADHFKKINDRLGHATGDVALVAIARMLKRSVRKDDIVGRIGGEEFAILLKGAGLEEARLVAERLRASIECLSVGPKGRAAQLSVSMGGLTFVGAPPYEALYRTADANLYRAKKNGRNRVDITSAVRTARPLGHQKGATAALARTIG
ncbi:hypothetical protein ASG54_01865 [Aureimonas sp. Leaf460]|nr:hypothetical protein ASG62_04600 [Aureimonas sp. Leaf427]KQT81464.1 hypothetical protein ASG54_01865 [Aureimonas sp. Leaf460]